jgi:very-short-patch-repair endonuclease
MGASENSRKKSARVKAQLTGAERFLWRHLRLRQIAGYKFRRQRPIGYYIIDFVCLEKRVVIEVDGGQHDARSSYDTERDLWLRNQGYSILRFWNHDVFTKIDAVMAVIQNALSEPPPLILPRKRGRKDSGTVKRGRNS